VTHRSHQHGEVLYTPGQDRADQQPKKTRRKSELRCQSRPHQRPSSRDGREVMSKEHPSRRSDIVMPVCVSVRGSYAAIVERQSFRGNERTVVTVGKGVHAQCTQQYREGVHDALRNKQVVADPASPIERILHP